jgi:hypothetical protein
MADALRIAKGFFPVKLVCPLLPFLRASVPGPLMLPADLAPAP